MRSKHPCAAIVAGCARFLLLAPSLWAQVPAVSSHTGVPHDWSERHIVFSRDGLARYPYMMEREPRVRYQFMQRFSIPDPTVVRDTDLVVDFTDRRAVPQVWNTGLGTGTVAANMFPAKYSFNADAPPSCSDFVVFGLNVAGVTGGQANLVAFNNLYSSCAAAPTVLFAYNVSSKPTGVVAASPVLSEDGTKIAFLESAGNTSYFHVLTWSAVGTITNAAAPSEWTTTEVAALITASSPWVDYASDTAYTGTNNGKVFALTPVFKGSPPAIITGWPIKISSGSGELTPPVLDNRLDLLMVGSKDGYLYQVNVANITAPTFTEVTVGKLGSTNHGVVAAPIVDVTNGTTFTISANSGITGVVGGVLAQVDTSTLAVLGAGNLGEASRSGTAINIYQPAFDNNYFNEVSTGTVYSCGTGTNNITPWEYAFGFNTSGVMNTAPTSSRQLLTSTAARCTGWTEYYNPNINGGTDFFFFGLTQDCTGTGTSGCVNAQTSSTFTSVPITGGPSGIVIDNDNTTVGSHIYFTAVGANTAYQLTQSGLN